MAISDPLAEYWLYRPCVRMSEGYQKKNVNASPAPLAWPMLHIKTKGNCHSWWQQTMRIADHGFTTTNRKEMEAHKCNSSKRQQQDMCWMCTNDRGLLNFGPLVLEGPNAITHLDPAHPRTIIHISIFVVYELWLVHATQVMSGEFWI